MTPRSEPPRMCSVRRRVLLGGWVVAGLLVLLRAGHLQVVEGERWRVVAQEQHRATNEIPAARGRILDRDGDPLVDSREIYRVEVAPTALRDRDRAASLLTETLGISRETARRVTDPTHPWRVVPGRFDPSVRDRLEGVRGVFLTREIERFYPHGELARGVLGSVRDGRGVGGIEQAYDEVLRGRRGRRVVAKDSEGRAIPGAIFQMREPVAGGDVRLTLDLDLQEIAHEALAEAVDATGAAGGDLLVTDPRTGEVLAMASFREGRTDALGAINTPYEPGSTFKPFTLAALLEHRLATLDDTVDTETGRWVAPDGRPLNDVGGPHGRITLAEALRVSSNVGVAKAALRLTPAQQYETLRDFGFGVATGVPLPGEVAGTLRRPSEWTSRSPVSLAIGYEASVTPLQMAMAYGSLANGGTLMEPVVVQRATDRDGHVVERGTPTRVRRVVSPEVARRLGGVLEEVVEEGTGTEAQLGAFRVAGKSGTSRAYVAGSGYAAGRYFASFAGFFPADDPQLVVFVKLDDPDGSYYGGATAAPVTRATMEAILAARKAPIDRRALLRARRPTRTEASTPRPRFASLPVAAAEPVDALRTVGAGAVGADPEVAPLSGGFVPVAIPDVVGLPARVAVRRLHALGFRIRWEGWGEVRTTAPRAGDRAVRGDTVVVRAARRPPGDRRGR